MKSSEVCIQGQVTNHTTVNGLGGGGEGEWGVGGGGGGKTLPEIDKLKHGSGLISFKCQRLLVFELT